MTKDLIIGMGEVGSALAEVFGERRDIATHDPNRDIHAPTDAPYDWMHIAFPCGEDIRILPGPCATSRNGTHPQSPAKRTSTSRRTSREPECRRGKRRASKCLS